MSTDSPLDIQTKLHALLCGELHAADRVELLGVIARDAQVQKMLEVMIAQQRNARAAFGYDRADAAIEVESPAVLERAKEAAVRSMRVTADHWRRTRQIVWRVAASIALICSLAVALSAHYRSAKLQEQLAEVRQRESLPMVTISADELATYRMLWKQVAQGAEPWLLVSNGEGEFGSVEASGDQTRVHDEVLLVSWRILTESGQQVYAAELLMAPGTPGAPVTVDLPSSSRIAGRSGTVTVSASNGHVMVGVSLHERGEFSVGVAGEVPVDMAVHELGQFRVSQSVLRVCVQTQRISGFRT